MAREALITQSKDRPQVARGRAQAKLEAVRAAKKKFSDLTAAEKDELLHALLLYFDLVLPEAEAPAPARGRRG